MAKSMLRQTSLSNHRWSLEPESIEIIREAVANAHNAILLYSIGNDSSVLLHLARQGLLAGAAAFPDPFTCVQPDPRNALAVMDLSF